MVCDHDQEATNEVITLKDIRTSLKTDVDKLKATNLFVVFEMVEIPIVLEIPPTTT